MASLLLKASEALRAPVVLITLAIGTMADPSRVPDS
jgi:hypothetical protein